MTEQKSLLVTQALDKMVQYFGADIRRINHALKVYSFAGYIARAENLPAELITFLEVAAVLHDIGIVEAEKKYNSSAGKYQEMEGPAIAKMLMSDTEVDPVNLDRICFLVGNHHSYDKIDEIDFRILVEADFLVNIKENKLEREMIESVKEKYFRTQTGIEILESMYLND